MNRRMVSIALALTLALGVSGNALASTTDDSASLKQIQDQRQELEIKTEQLDNQITQAMQQIQDNKDKIAEIAKEIEQNQADLDEAQGQIENQQESFNQRAKSMYINGNDGYLGVILDSQNLNDFVARVDNIKKIMGYDKQVVDDLNNKKDLIESKKQTLCDQNNQLISLKADNEKKLAQLSSDKSQETELLASLTQKEKQLTSENEVSESTSLSRGGASVSSNAVVAYASNFLGTPYEWGGNGPSSFDCSGFTCYVFAHFGVSLPRVASDQQNVGTAVSKDNLQPGDLVFFGSTAYHVGIYVGNGSYINAPKTGDVVKISSIDRSDYSGARRVL
ncbi:glycoside hydrolase [Clostridium fermenticellae]|uniref:Glycoside hydrolase n=1 Tax=Clostridium fermenticellae TaxID=2068654 RepID=A0A386H0D5_9CLOT|nr:C40 family peptidase [Clostridium fermenticellae]AYD39114.1 glycoside hydrolase [Clostridium fermenticellae]